MAALSRYVDAKGRELYDQYGTWQRVDFVPFWDLPMGQDEGEELAVEVDNQ